MAVHLSEVLKQQSSSISFTQLKYNSLEIYRNTLEHFFVLIRILLWHKEDKKYLRAPALRGKKTSLVCKFLNSFSYLLTLHSLQPVLNRN